MGESLQSEGMGRFLVRENICQTNALEASNTTVQWFSTFLICLDPLMWFLGCDDPQL